MSTPAPAPPSAIPLNRTDGGLMLVGILCLAVAMASFFICRQQNSQVNELSGSPGSTNANELVRSLISAVAARALAALVPKIH